MSEPKIKMITRTVEVRGIELPYVWTGQGKANQLSGTVFVSMDELVEVAEQDEWAGAFGNSLVLGEPWADLALAQAGLAVRETRGGVHGTKKLKKFLKKNGYL